MSKDEPSPKKYPKPENHVPLDTTSFVCEKMFPFPAGVSADERLVQLDAWYLAQAVRWCYWRLAHATDKTEINAINRRLGKVRRELFEAEPEGDDLMELVNLVKHYFDATQMLLTKYRESSNRVDYASICLRVYRTHYPEVGNKLTKKDFDDLVRVWSPRPRPRTRRGESKTDGKWMIFCDVARRAGLEPPSPGSLERNWKRWQNRYSVKGAANPKRDIPPLGSILTVHLLFDFLIAEVAASRTSPRNLGTRPKLRVSKSALNAALNSAWRAFELFPSLLTLKINDFMEQNKKLHKQAAAPK